MKLISMSTAYKQVHPTLVNFQGGGAGLNLKIEPFFRRKDKLVFVMGATGTGKSRLAIDLATYFPPAEIINSDKIQVYKGLDIVTNKITKEECRGVPHHLLGITEPNADFSAIDFCDHASSAIDSILQRDRLPIIAGGSNSYIDALVNGDPEFQLRYECCFLWVDVSLPVLYNFVSARVDRMVEIGLVDEVRKIFDPQADYSRGIRRAIGVPELDKYLRAESIIDERTRVKFLENAIARIKENTCILACRQLQKLHRLNNKWKQNMHRIDATEVFLQCGEQADEVWDKLVARPSNKIIRQFLYDSDPLSSKINLPPETTATIISNPSVSIPTVVAATR